MPKQIHFRGLFGCQRRCGCPQTAEMPDGCPLWRDEIWEDEELQPKRIVGCGFQVDAMRERWTAGRAFQAAQTAQAMRNEHDAVVQRFDKFFALVKAAGPPAPVLPQTKETSDAA